MVEKFTFQPNPNFSPPDLETQALTAMTGEIWIDPAQERVTRLEGHLQQDADFGWGILGRLNKGGWIVIEQADVGGGTVADRALPDADERRVVFKNQDLRHHGRGDPVCAGARGTELPASHRDAARRRRKSAAQSRALHNEMDSASAKTKRPHPQWIGPLCLVGVADSYFILTIDHGEGEQGEGLDEGQAEDQERSMAGAGAGVAGQRFGGRANCPALAETAQDRQPDPCRGRRRSAPG